MLVGFSQTVPPSLQRHTITGAAVPRELPPLIPGAAEFTDPWLMRYHGRRSRDEVHALSCHVMQDLLVTGRGHLFAGGRLINSAEVMPKYWRDLVASGAIDIEREVSLPSRRIKEPCVVFMGHGHRVYGHFLIEMLPRLEIARASLAELGLSDARYLVSSNVHPWFLQFMSDLGIDEQRLEFYDPSSETAVLERAVVPTFASRDGVFHPYAATLFARAARRVDQGVDHDDAEPVDRVFVPRIQFAGKDSIKRTLKNETELSEIAHEEFGFKIVAPEQLGWREQIRAFRNAAIIVGEFGSGLHNSLFARAGTIVGAISVLNVIQSEICALMSQRNAYLKINRDELDNTVFSVNVDLFRKWLDVLCGEAGRR